MIAWGKKTVQKVRQLEGWKKYFLAFGVGLGAALAFPPFNLIPFLWVAFPVCFLLLQSCHQVRQAFAVGWCFSFGLLTLSLYWIAGALFVDLARFWWLVPFAIAGLPALFSIYYGLAAVAVNGWGQKKGLDGLDGVLIFALAWFVADYARGHLFTGFPWDILGYVWASCLPVLQLTSIVGIYGVTLVTLVMAALPAAWLGMKRPPACVGVIALLFLSGVAVWGQWRISTAPRETVPDVRLRLVQPNVSQKDKWNHEDRDGRFRRLLDVSFASIDTASPRVTHVIWPETAIPYLLMEDSVARAMIAQGLGRGADGAKRMLLTGGLRRQEDEKGVPYYLNALLVMDEKGVIGGVYDKHHLVPFGEYIPFADYLPIRSIVSMGADFMAGEGTRTLRTYGFPPFSPLVCYEAIFPGDVIDSQDRPSVMVNVTNDGWYEGTIGPSQHYAISRVRAIEEGVPLIRVANKGVSAVVDAYGRAVAFHDARESATIDSDLPRPTMHNTLYAIWRDEAVFFIAWVVFFAALWLKRAKSS